MPQKLADTAEEGLVLFGVRAVAEPRTPTGSFSHRPDLSARLRAVTEFGRRRFAETERSAQCGATAGAPSTAPAVECTPTPSLPGGETDPRPGASLVR